MMTTLTPIEAIALLEDGGYITPRCASCAYIYNCQIRQTAMHEAVSVLIGICDSFGPGVKSQVAHQCLYAVKALLADEQRHYARGGRVRVGER